jgi:hypothetical protein
MNHERVQSVLVIVDAIALEVNRAMGMHAPMSSAHEAYSVILEELDEFWEEVKKKREERSRERLVEELTHVAAMAVRAIHDLGLAKTG